MKRIIKEIIEKNYKEVSHIGIIEFVPFMNKKEYRVIFKVKDIDINFVINDEVRKIYSTDKNYFEQFIISIIDTNILYNFKER